MLLYVCIHIYLFIYIHDICDHKDYIYHIDGMYIHIYLYMYVVCMYVCIQQHV